MSECNHIWRLTKSPFGGNDYYECDLCERDITTEHFALIEKHARLTAELAEAREKLQTEKDSRHERFLEWRGISENEYDNGKCCKDCSGTGYKMYGTTSTWYGGLGGQQITSGICDKCWGSGNINNPWSNLRKLWNLKNEDKKQLEQYKVEITRLTAELAEAHALSESRARTGISYKERAEQAEKELAEILKDIKLHLTWHEHGCAYLGKYVDYEEIYK